MDESQKFTELEQAYDLLAVTLDTVGKEKERVFLCKLALTLANEVGSFKRFSVAVQTAQQDLPERV